MYCNKFTQSTIDSVNLEGNSLGKACFTNSEESEEIDYGTITNNFTSKKPNAASLPKLNNKVLLFGKALSQL